MHMLFTTRKPPLFPLGQIAVSRGVAELMTTTQAHVQLADAFTRHADGDWGDVHPDDVGANERSLEEGSRLMSVYTVSGQKVWIFTEADRSVTTAILPDEY